MTKYINPVMMTILLTIGSSAIKAQDASKESPAPSTNQPAASTKKSCEGACCMGHMKKEAPKKGFHHSIEWGGIYGGPRNQVSYRMFGHTFNTDMRDRDALRVNLGYLINPYLYVGGGVGAEYQYKSYNDRIYSDVLPPIPVYSSVNYTGSLWIVPIYGEIKGYLLKKPISPFLEYRMGYAPAIYVGQGQRTVENSSYNNLSIGVRIYSHLSITAGYLFMYQPTSVSGYDETNHNRVILDSSSPYQHRFTLGVAIGM